MAFELGSIIARIKADTSGFTSGVASAKSTLSGFTGGLGASVSASKTFLTGLTAVGAALGAAGAFAIKSAAGIEQTRTAFTTMLGDGDKAGKLMKELSKFAAETPFEFPEIADAGKKLLAFGFAAKDVQPELRRLGDVASGLGIPIGELSELYGKAKVQGRLYMEDVNQLTGRGIPIIQEFAKQFHVSESKVRDLVEQGKIGFPELQKGIKNMTSAGGQFAGGMAAQSKTVNGLISTLTDNVGAFARNLVGVGNDGSIAKGSVFAIVSEGLTKVIDFLNNNQQKIIDGIGTIFGWIQQNAPLVVGIIVGMLLPAFASIVAAAASAAAGFLIAIAPFALAGAALGLIFQKFQPQIMAFLASLKPLFDQFVQFAIGAMPIVQNALTVLLNIFTGLVTFLFNAFTTVWPIVVAAFQFLWPLLALIGQVIITQLWPALQQLWSALVNIWNAVAPVLLPVLKVLGVIIGAILVAAIAGFLAAIVAVIAIISVVVQVISFLGNVWANIFRAMRSVVSVVVNAVVAYIRMVLAVYTAIFNAMRSVAGAVWGTIRGTIAGAINFIAGIIRSIIGTVSGVMNTIRSFFSSAANSLRDRFNSAVDSVRNIINRVKGFVSSMVNGVRGAVSGVTNAITAPFRSAVDTIQGLMAKAKEAMKNLNPLQRHSPSIVDWVKKGTRIIADEYDSLNNSIAAGSTAARIQSIGTARSFANVSAAEVATRANGSAGRAGNITINVEGVLADSPEAKRKFGVEIVSLVNDNIRAKGGQEIPT